MKHQRPFLKWAVVFCFAFSFFLAEARAADAPKMTKEELQTRLGNPDVIVIDNRTDHDWTGSGSKIKGAVREEPGKVMDWMNKYPMDKTLVFYCS